MRYALGRDYHKVRGALAALASAIQAESGPFGYRVCVDTAPVLRRAHARDAGLGWIGKHTNLIARDAGSRFFLGEILTDLPLPEDAPASAHCGSCQACLPAPHWGHRRALAPGCAPLHLLPDDRHPGSIPLELRAALGNRVYGCDDCQLVCPEQVPRRPRTRTSRCATARWHGPGGAVLAGRRRNLRRMRGSAIYRIGYTRWLRNIAVALGNAPSSSAVIEARGAA